jgi:hypothetical protein
MWPAELGAGAIWPALESVWPVGLDLEFTERVDPPTRSHGGMERSGMPEWRSVGGSTRRSKFQIQGDWPH